MAGKSDGFKRTGNRRFAAGARGYHGIQISSDVGIKRELRREIIARWNPGSERRPQQTPDRFRPGVNAGGRLSATALAAGVQFNRSRGPQPLVLCLSA